MTASCDRLIRGDVVTTETILRDSDIAVRGQDEAPAADTLDHSGRLILCGRTMRDGTCVPASSGTGRFVPRRTG